MNQELIKQTTKRGFDVVLAGTALVVLSPLLLGLACLIRYKLGGPVLFRQHRPGLSGKPFELMKFRTMTSVCNQNGELLPDELRLTKFGQWLRSTSLDELPELINVFKGDMSLVGPRPLLMEYLPLYTAEQNQRHLVQPGITGWAQINGRNLLSWEAKFDLDVWYVKHWSIWLDLRIIFLTLVKVVRREGISQPGNATATVFRGSSQVDVLQ
ncbi:MAG: sugar transferase [Acidobacteria bacterium]|nr:sugar transferase [Acidobacteriota bacterium]